MNFQLFTTYFSQECCFFISTYRKCVGHGQRDRFFVKVGVVSKLGQQWRREPQCPSMTPPPLPVVSLAALWFARQMSQVHLSFGLHPAITIRVLHSPSTPPSQPNDWLLPGSRRRRSSLQKHRAKQMQEKQVSNPAVKWEAPRKAPFAALSMWFMESACCPITRAYSGILKQTNTNCVLPLWRFTGSLK